MHSSCPGRGAAFFTLRRRAGTHVEENGPRISSAPQGRSAASGESSRIPGHQSAVDRDHSPGQERGGRQAQAQRHVGDLFRIAVAAERGAALGVDCLVLLRNPFRDRRADRARTDAVHGDAIAAEFDRSFKLVRTLPCDVPLGDHGDVFDRYMIRILEMRESVKILQQAFRDVVFGPYAPNFTSMKDLVYGGTAISSSLYGLSVFGRRVFATTGFAPSELLYTNPAFPMLYMSNIAAFHVEC